MRQEIAHTMCARRPGGTRKARQRRAFQSVDKVNFFENTVFRASSAHEIDFATQNHKNREHGPGHPLLPLFSNSPCVSRLLYCFTFPRRAGCPHPAAAWELLDVRVLRVGRGDLTPPQTQIVGETLVPRQAYIVSYRYRFPIPSAEHTNTQANFRDFYQFLSCARHGYMV